MRSDNRPNDNSTINADILRTYLLRALADYRTTIQNTTQIGRFIYYDKSDKDIMEAPYLMPRRLAVYLNPAIDENKAKLLILMDSILTHGTKLLQDTLLKTISLVPMNAPPDQQFERGLDAIFGDGSYESNFTQNNMATLKATVKHACERLQIDPSVKASIDAIVREEPYKALNIFITDIAVFDIKFENLKKIMIEAVEEYLKNINVSRFNIFASGTLGKERAIQFLEMLKPLNPHDEHGSVQILLILHAFFNTSSNQLRKLILAGIGNASGDQMIAHGIATLFGTKMFEFYFDLIRPIIDPTGPRLPAIRYSFKDQPPWEIRNILLNSPYIPSEAPVKINDYCERIVVEILSHAAQPYLKKDSSLAKDYLAYLQLLNQPPTEIEKLLASPPPGTLLTRLPPELRGVIGSFLTRKDPNAKK